MSRHGSHVGNSTTSASTICRLCLQLCAYCQLASFGCATRSSGGIAMVWYGWGWGPDSGTEGINPTISDSGRIPVMCSGCGRHSAVTGSTPWCGFGLRMFASGSSANKSHVTQPVHRTILCLRDFEGVFSSSPPTSGATPAALPITSARTARAPPGACCVVASLPQFGVRYSRQTTNHKPHLSIPVPRQPCESNCSVPKFS